MTIMKSRIEYIISSESLSNLQFAQSLEISPASITHILSGRNNPSLDIVTRIARKYPHYNLRWLLLGDGAVYCNPIEQQIAHAESPNLFSNTTPEQNDCNTQNSLEQSVAQTCCPESQLQRIEQEQPRCVEEKLIVCLPDGTYKEYIKQ